jgi:hypothetical protein
LGWEKGIKKQKTLKRVFCFEYLSILEAFAAVDRTVIAGLEGNLAGLSTACAYCIIHLACLSAVCCFASIAARFATLRLVGKALLSIKFLLTGSEGEFLSTILADQCLVVVHEIPL